MSMDWQSLTEKLRKMGVQVGVEKPLQPTPRKVVPLERLVDVREMPTIFGPVFSSRHDYPASHTQGEFGLYPRTSFNRLSSWAKITREEAIDIGDLVFLDTETTGLSGGTGTMAFMVGAARFLGTTLVMEQFFIRHPAEEPALLAALEQFCSGMQAVVTYNGKAFDIPILNTRYIMNSMRSPFDDLAHFDLLPLTRRIWKARLQQCNLGNIEKEILCLQRELADVPGYLVPEYYRDYLQTGSAENLAGIFYHNEEDVVSLAALFSLLAEILEDPVCWHTNHPQDILSVGRVMEQLGHVDLASELYAQSASAAELETHVTNALVMQARLLKREQQVEESISLWLEAAKSGSLLAMEELAKYYEHRAKDLEQALHWAGMALTVTVEMHDLRGQKSFLYRVERIQRKLGNSK